MPGERGEIQGATGVPARAAGVVVAGGRGRRMGQDKAQVLLDGQPMARRVGAALQAVAEEVFLVTNRPGRHRNLGLPTRHDLVPNLGPLGGLYTALVFSPHPWCLLAACDYPLLSPGTVRTLLARANDTLADAVVPVVDGRAQPLLAAYRNTCLPTVRDRLVRGRLKMVELFSVLDVDWLTMEYISTTGGNRWSFLNVNTPEDHARAASYLRAWKSGQAGSSTCPPEIG